MLVWPHHCSDTELHRGPFIDSCICRLCCNGGRLHQQALTHHHLTTTCLLRRAAGRQGCSQCAYPFGSHRLGLACGTHGYRTI